METLEMVVLVDLERRLGRNSSNELCSLLVQELRKSSPLVSTIKAEALKAILFNILWCI